MAKTMLAARLHAGGDFRIDTVEVPVPKADEVLIKVHRTGICGTDLHIVSGNFPAPNLPLTLGHEFSGTIVQLGGQGTSLNIGDKVVVDINIACDRCTFCRLGSKLFCASVRQLGVHDAGALAEYVVAPIQNVYVLPDSISLDAAAYVEPLACAIHGQDRIGIRAGETVLIIGGGPMGLAHIVLAKLQGAAKIIVSEPDSHRRQIALKLGADIAIDPIKENFRDLLNLNTNNIGPDVVIEAVGSIPTYEDSVAVVRRGGRILAYGAAPQDASMQLRPFDVYAKELTIVGSYAGTYDTWPRAINLIAAERFDPSLIVDTVRPLSEAVEALQSLKTNRSIVKIHIQVS